MVVSVELTSDELSQIQAATGNSSPTIAVTVAAREYLRVSLLKQLKNASGQVDFDLDWQAQEALELGELKASPAVA